MARVGESTPAIGGVTFPAMVMLSIDGYSPTVDAATHSLVNVTHEHHEIHEGKSFSCHYSVTTAATDDHRTAVGFRTPNTTTWGHLTLTISSDQPAEVFLLEAPTIDDDAGTDLPIFNRNRNSANLSTFLSLENPPVAGGATSYTEAEIAAANFSGGTAIDGLTLAGGKGPRVVGGSSRGSQEWELKQNTKYIAMIQNIGANATTHALNLDWYEKADED